MTTLLKLTGEEDKEFFLSPEKIIAMEPISDRNEAPLGAQSLISTPIGGVFAKESVSEINTLILSCISETSKINNRR